MSALEALKKKNEQWYLFVLEYVKDFNGTRAAKEVGYKNPGVYASQLLKKPDIQEALKELTAKVAEKAEITVDKVLADLEQTRIEAKRAKDFSPAVKCSELQGRYLKMFTDKVEQSTTVVVKRKFTGRK